MNVSRVVVFQITGPAPGGSLDVGVVGDGCPANPEGDCSSIDKWMSRGLRGASRRVGAYGREWVGEERRDGCLT